MTDEPETCVVWWHRYGTEYFEICDDEEQAANWAVTLDDTEEGAVEGVQFRDGRVVKREDWQAYQDEERRRYDLMRQSALAAPPPRRPTREIISPFTGKRHSVPVDEAPEWMA